MGPDLILVMACVAPPPMGSVLQGIQLQTRIWAGSGACMPSGFNQEKVTGVLFTWWFPKVMIPLNHPFLGRIFHYKPSNLGTPMAVETSTDRRHLSTSNSKLLKTRCSFQSFVGDEQYLPSSEVKHQGENSSSLIGVGRWNMHVQ